MEFLVNSIELNNSTEIIIKILVSVALGFVIGLERELTNKSAGLRTHVLLCLGSTVFTILSLYGFAQIDPSSGTIIQNDPARIAAQILTGIGFIGGGVVLHHGVSIYGLTTAASLWIIASIGMAVGTGSFVLAIATTLIALIVLVVIGQLERKFLKKLIRKGNRITASFNCHSDDFFEIQQYIYAEFENILEISTKRSKKNEEFYKISIILDIFDVNPLKTLHEKLQKVNNIDNIILQQNIYEL